MNIGRLVFGVAVAGTVSLAVIGSTPAALVYDFEWTDASNTGQNTQNWQTIRGGEHSVGITFTESAGCRAARGTGTYDQQHNGVLFVSPEFVLDPTSTADLTFQLSAGRGHGGSSWGTDAPASRQGVIDEIAANGGLSSSAGEMGVALRRASTGEYVAVKEKTTAANVWESLSFSRTDLDNLISTYGPNEVYSFEFFEYFHGGWGHVELDNVSVPGRVVESRMQNSGFEGIMAAHAWNTCYADTARIGDWYAPLFGDRMQIKTEPNGNKYLGHNTNDPAGQGTFAYQAVDAPAFASLYELSFDYFNANGTGGSAEENHIAKSQTL